MCVVSVQIGGFLSTLSLRRATIHYDNYNLHCVISIHALLAESDLCHAISFSAGRISIHALLAESDTHIIGFLGKVNNFYPRSPCGERPPNIITLPVLFVFLSTLSLRRATVSCYLDNIEITISIHALLAESDSKSAQNSGALLRI